MSLTTEDGTGVSGAESYATVAQIDAYWGGRTHKTEAATWAAGTTAKKEGAAREATAFLDAQFGPYYLGSRSGYLQGLLWPRVGTEDAAGYALPDLPPMLVAAVAELAVRALSGPLMPDATIDGTIKSFSETTGPLSETTVYQDGASSAPRYGFLQGLMAAVCDGTQPGFNKPNWAWR
jgi:hypothetical protein